MLYLVYKTTHIPTGRFYIGRHLTLNEDDGYLGSGVVITNMVKKHPIAQFSREILKYCSSEEEMILTEIEEIKKVFTEDLCMNRVIGDPGAGTVASFSPAARKAMSESRKRTHNTPEVRAKLSEIQRNRSEETKRKIGLKHRGKTISAEMRAKQSAKLSGELNPRALKWTVEYEDGSTESVTSLKSWCASKGIKYTTLYMKLKRGDYRFHNGIRIVEFNPTALGNISRRE